MHAVVSLLDEPHYAKMESLWRELEGECGLAGVALTPLPHFSWHIAAEYDHKQVDARLTELAKDAEPFIVRAGGLGLFTGPQPVIYISLIKSPHLARFHGQIWNAVNTVAIGPNGHYAPDEWVPHITLAFGDVNASKLGCALEQLAFQRINWEIRVDNLAKVYTTSGQVGKLQSHYPFQPGNSA